mmetsp:Transcript_17798/g.40176  ORF Transcript_17798/g.40176 Transcript_17798/m.40176 type:complete len:216 (+) Transcript_17798:207-854(+)
MLSDPRDSSKSHRSHDEVNSGGPARARRTAGLPLRTRRGPSRGSVRVRQERREQLVAVDLELVHGRGPVGRPGRRGTRGGVPPQDRAGVDRGLEGADDHAAACLETALAVVHGRQGRVHEGDRGPGVRLGRRVGRGGAGLVGLRDDLVDEGCADEQEEHDRRRHCRGRPGSPYPSGGACHWFFAARALLSPKLIEPHRPVLPVSPRTYSPRLVGW